MKPFYPTIDDVYEKLNTIPMFGVKGRAAANFSLSAIRRFSSQMGDPHLDLPAIHVAGTNGKGTTCRMLASVYQSAGYKTGLFTSPHLVEYRERIMVNGVMIPEKKLLEFFRCYALLIDSTKLSYFELSAAIAFWFFKDQDTDIAIFETGLGGRLDATNIVHPLASVITSIGLDHTEILGHTLEEIAAEKAGIIKKGRTVITGRIPEQAMQVVERVCNEKGSEHIHAKSDRLNTKLFETSGKPTLAEKLNAPIVTTVVRCLSEQYPVSYSQIKDGIAFWRNRYPSGTAFRQLHPDFPWYFDGAHNIDSIHLLMDQLKTEAPLSEWTFVLSMMKDKLTADIANQLSDLGHIFVYYTESERAATTEQVLKVIPDAIELPIDADKNPTDKWVDKHKSELVIFGGSFYFYEAVMRWIKNTAIN